MKIAMKRVFLFLICGLGLVLVSRSHDLTATGQGSEVPPRTLPSTDPLTWKEPLDLLLMDGAHRFIEKKIEEAPEGRAQFWSRDLSSEPAYEASVRGNRERFQKIVGAVNRGQERNHNIGLRDLPLSPAMEKLNQGEESGALFEGEGYRIWRVRWAVLRGVHGEGLLLEPEGEALAQAVVLPDADQPPEELAGLIPGLPLERQIPRQLAAAGVRVIVPALINRDTILSGDREQTYREWIYRQAFHMGRHIIGYEIEKVQAAFDWLEATAGARLPLGLAGYGEGGLIALYTSALDTRVDTTLVSGYFGPREEIWSEPIYRNIWSLLREFGDAEVASLIAPRSLIIEHSRVPEASDQKGSLRDFTYDQVRHEEERIDALTAPGFQKRVLVAGSQGEFVKPWDMKTQEQFLRHLGIDERLPLARAEPTHFVPREDSVRRNLAQVWELDDYTQWLVRNSDQVRNDFFLYRLLPEFERPRWSTEAEHPTSSPDSFIEEAGWYRDYLWREIFGKFDDSFLPFHPRTRLVEDRADFTAYDVVLDVFPDLTAWGMLCIPKDLKPGEQRPVVVLQHGRNGLPINILRGAYNDAGPRLLERGFIVFAPHNLYRGEDRYRWLDRKANSVRATLFSFLISQHDQMTRWLASLPFVDGDRIGFYGNSYGGETAVRVPALLESYALSICASDFNDWTRKVADTRDWHSFMNTIEWEMPYFNMGSTFSYAELVYLIFPRPFMVERGHHDLVAPDQWVAYEFAKVRWLYDQFGLPDRRAIEFFQGGHTMKGNRTFDFLHRHLDWPKRAKDAD